MQYSRRSFLGLLGMGALSPCVSGGATRTAVEIEMRTSADRTAVWFDPVGLLVSPGTTVRWVVAEPNPHTVTAYHPSNGNRPARIPPDAEPWDSGYVQKSGAAFEKTFPVEGVYDYFCKPHEAAGMVGRIVVGTPDGSGVQSFEGRAKGAEPSGPTDLPDEAQKAFPSVERIVREQRVR